MDRVAFTNVVKTIGNGYEGVVPFRNDGKGYRDLRPDFLDDEDVFLSGYVDEKNNVTYESHNFWIRCGEPGYGGRFDAELFVMHGGGIQSLRVEYHVALGLKCLIEAGEMKAAYHLCWGLFDLVRSSNEIGASDMKAKVYTAFVNGKLKKRKMRGEDSYSVKIEK